MAKMKMQKVEIIALLRDIKGITEKLQMLEAIEISDIEDESLIKPEADFSILQFEKNISEANIALETLKKYCNIKEPFLSSLNGREYISRKDFLKKKENINNIIKKIEGINSFNEKINEYKNNISKLEASNFSLFPFISLDLSQNLKATKSTNIIKGTISHNFNIDTISEKINYFHYEITKKEKDKIYIFFICLKEDYKALYELLKENNFSFFESASPLTPNEEIKDNNEHIKHNTSLIKESEKNIRKMAHLYEDIKFAIDYYTLKKEEYEGVRKLAMTKNTVVLKGYVPSLYSGFIKKDIESRYTAVVNISAPDEDDDVPVKLINSKFASPVERITEMYALPNKRDIDPSSVMAFFYYLFFGMMLSDAGYGIITVISTSIILKRKSVEGNLRKSINMFLYCGISTIFWGILFGSWFGDLPQVIASQFFNTNIKTTALWFEPLTDPMKLLLFSFGLGICHLFLGLYVNFKLIKKEKGIRDAIYDVVPVFLTILGIAPVAAGILTTVPRFLSDIGKYLAIFGAISIILTASRTNKNIFMRFFGGIYGLYNVATGYLSDILSYSRLLALGLATGSIASVINLIATMPSNIYLKAITLIIAGTAGHLLNLGINLLGAYVHTGRLQFVELFSKFYEGGGRAFQPFSPNTKYFKFERKKMYE